MSDPESGRAGARKTDFRVWLFLCIILLQCFSLVMLEKSVIGLRKIAEHWKAVAETCGGIQRAALPAAPGAYPRCLVIRGEYFYLSPKEKRK